MGFDFGNISAKHQERVKHVHSGLVNSCNEAMAEWIENIVGKSRDAGCISRYTFDGRGVCLWLNNTSCKTRDGIPTFTFTINGMILQTCPFSISGIKLDIDKSYFQGGQMLLYISNYTNGPEKKWNTYHSTDWMITDEWANRFGNCSIDLSDLKPHLHHSIHLRILYPSSPPGIQKLYYHQNAVFCMNHPLRECCM